jgi:phospholipid/cholesterol/gamma-HCH transport system ATP-binding protein
MSAFLEFRDIWKAFEHNEVLKGASLSIEKGETTVILGASGSGKSVLLKHAIGLLQPDRGQVLVEGEDITGYTEERLETVRKKVAMVFQSGALFDSMTVGENVGYALREHTAVGEDEIRERVRETLAMVDLRGVEDKMPSDLSGGMRKRVSLARAVAIRPDGILYDEPTTGLDPVTSNTINDLIMSLRRALQATSVVVTHDLVCAFKVADRIAFLHEGRMAFVGTRDEARRHGEAAMHRFITGGDPGGGYERILQY